MNFPPEDAALQEKILTWTASGFPLEVRRDAALRFAEFLNGQQNDAIEAYLSDLKFGTGGLRGVIGNGPGRMNVWTVGRATLGFCNYLLKHGVTSGKSLAIAYDSRRMSLTFARTTAGIAASLGFEVYLFERETPTPLLSFAVRELKTTGGVVITASHNPPEYNGYKVYLDDGGQLTGPAQQLVEAEIESIHDWSAIPFAGEDSQTYRDRVHLIGPDIEKAYHKKLKELPFVSGRSERKYPDIQLVYSPLHGTGGYWMERLLKAMEFSVTLVSEQAEPDGEFPTVSYPNPEEREALALSLARATAVNADLFLATDPDSDRLGAGFRRSQGDYVLFNGNQLGSVMCAFLIERLKKHSANLSNYIIYKTIVTSDLQKSIAEKNGVRIEEVLTGFKYIAEKIKSLEGSGLTYLFGGEESYGYLPVDFVRDKDALASALLLVEIAAEKKDLIAYLDDIYLEYGLYLEDLKSVTMKGASGQAQIQAIIDSLRRNRPMGLQLGKRTVTGIIDYDTHETLGKASFPGLADLPRSNVIQLLLEPEGKLTIRPSGTEPKVKLYSSLRHTALLRDARDLEAARKELGDELASIAGLFLAHAGLA
ncbi:MAG: phospho-sugar mutase [Spirochaetales bacterium]|nr:phospho-sugar mutase [Spirochaetales bacterium]